MENKEWKQYFENKYSEEDPWGFRTSTYEQVKYDRQIQAIQKYVDTPKRILEIGCAEGAHTEMLLEVFEEAELLGVDISEQAIDRAKERVDQNRVEFQAVNILDEIEEIDEGFDIIVFSETLYYVADSISVRELFEFLSNLSGILNSRGIICVTNIVDQPSGEEKTLTKQEILNCQFGMLDSFVEEIYRANFREKKEESGNVYEYEIRLFQRDRMNKT